MVFFAPERESVTVRTLWIPERIAYDGSQIGGGWARARFGVEGDSIVAFVGPCDVRPEHMVDLEDLAAGRRIFSEEMLHFLIEHHDADLDRAILRQRLFAAAVAEEVSRRSSRCVERRVSDLFVDGRKMNVSVATRTPRSAKIHFGINVRAPGPAVEVPTAGIAEWGIAPQDLARSLLDRYAREEAALERDRRKVRWVE
jgi:hypothetical protein